MASSTLAANNYDSKPEMNKQTAPNAGDDATEAAGSNRGKMDEEIVTKLVKWQMPGDHDVSSAKRTLQQLLCYLLVSHPGEIMLIDGKQREWVYYEHEDEEKFAKECEQISVQVHPIKNKEKRINRWVAITKIASASTISQWKDNVHFYSSVDEESTYIFPHPFTETQWDITTIGFIKNIHAVHYPQDLLRSQLNDMIRKQNKNPPTFQLISQRITTADKKASTKAYTVQCAREHASQLLHLFTHGDFRLESNQIFIPFKYKTKKQDLFLQCIRQQNEIYHKTWLIKLEGINMEVMNYLRKDIAQIMGVQHIVPSKRLEDIGEWKILVDQTKCAFIHRQMTESWQAMLSKIPSQALESLPQHFSLPMISSKRARDYQETDSDADSYGSLLTTGTALSMMTNEDASMNELPDDYKFPSYASAAANSTKTGFDTDVSSPTMSTTADWTHEKQQLEAQIRAQTELIEKIQADLESKIMRSTDLEEQLAQAIELAHSRDARHAEMLSRFETLMNNFPQVNITPTTTGGHDGISETQSQPTTPERQPLEPVPPPSRLNTTSSPHRTLYTIFRQSGGLSRTPLRTGPRRQAKRKQPPTLLTQPMDTDDESRPPPPGANPGKKTE